MSKKYQLAILKTDKTAKPIKVIDERMAAKKFADIKWKLVDRKTGKKINTGDKATTFRDEPCVVIGFFYPHKPNSSGKVYVQFATDEERMYYPGVINAQYRRLK